MTVNHDVAGSSPAGGAILISTNKKCLWMFFFYVNSCGEICGMQDTIAKPYFKIVVSVSITLEDLDFVVTAFGKIV